MQSNDTAGPEGGATNSPMKQILKEAAQRLRTKAAGIGFSSINLIDPYGL